MFHQFLFPPTSKSKSKSISVLCLTAVACFASFVQYSSAADHEFVWSRSDEPYQYLSISASEESIIILDASALSPGSKRTLSVKGLLPGDYWSLTIRTKGRGTTDVGPCSQNSNKLLLETQHGNKTDLICGNELVQNLMVQTPFKLTFFKGPNPNRPELDAFDITVLGKYMSDLMINNLHLDVQQQPRLLLSPLYPDLMKHFGGSLSQRRTYYSHLTVDSGYAVFLQARYLAFGLAGSGGGTGCADADSTLDISGGGSDTDTICYNQLMTTVMTPAYSGSGVEVKYTSKGMLYRMTFRGFELEYRSVKHKPAISCNAYGSRFNVGEPTFLSITLNRTENCVLVLSSNASQKALVLTSLSAKNYWANLCGSYSIKVSVGDKELPVTECGHTTFGVIRAMPGQDITVAITVNNTSTTGGHTQYNKKFGFVVEAVHPDSFSETVSALPSPSYIWKPRSKPPTTGETIVRVLAPTYSCVEFSTLDKSFKPKTTALSDLVSLYSGSWTANNFELTRDCNGALRTDSVINNGWHRITTAVANSWNSDWLKISLIGDEPCKISPTHLEMESINRVYSLFESVTFTKHMSCLYVLPQLSVPTKFRGGLKNFDGAKLEVTYHNQEKIAARVRFRAAYKSPPVSAWFYSDDTLNIVLRTGTDIGNDMATFDYAATDSEYVTLKQNKTFYTPDYPNRLKPNLRYNWQFAPDEIGSRQHKYIYIEILKLELPCDSTTKLYIKGVDEINDASTAVCGVERFLKVFPQNVDVELIGGSDHSVKAFSFTATLKELNYAESCNITRSLETHNTRFDVTGTLVPGQYLLPFYCRMVIGTPRDSKLDLVVNRVQTASTSTNSYNKYNCDGLMVYDGDREGGSILLNACHSDGDRVISTGRYITIVMRIRNKIDVPAIFDFSVTLHNEPPTCHSGVIKETAREQIKILTSPGYPNNYESGSDCRWQIYSGDGFQVEVKVTQVRTEYDSSCSYDYLEIFDGPSINSESLGRLCGTVTNMRIYRSTRGVLTVQFVSDGSITNRGFHLTYYTKEQATPGATGTDGTNGTNNEEDDDSDNKTGVIVGACLSAIVGVFGVGVMCVWLVHKKRVRDQRNRRRRTREATVQHFNNSTHESSVYVINPVIVNNAQPPPYSGLINMGFMEEPPPSYHDALSQLTPPPPPPAFPSSTNSARAPPPPYSLSTPRGHTDISEEEEPEAGYETVGASPNDDDTTSDQVYWTLRPISLLHHQQQQQQQQQQAAADSNNGDNGDESAPLPPVTPVPHLNPLELDHQPQSRTYPSSSSSSSRLDSTANPNYSTIGSERERHMDLNTVDIGLGLTPPPSLEGLDEAATASSSTAAQYINNNNQSNGVNKTRQGGPMGRSTRDELPSSPSPHKPGELPPYANLPYSSAQEELSNNNNSTASGGRTPNSPPTSDDYSLSHHHPDSTGNERDDDYSLGRYPTDAPEIAEYSLARATGRDGDNNNNSHGNAPTPNEPNLSRSGRGSNPDPDHTTGGRHKPSHDRWTPKKRARTRNSRDIVDDEVEYSLAHHPDDNARRAEYSLARATSDNYDRNAETNNSRSFSPSRNHRNDPPPDYEGGAGRNKSAPHRDGGRAPRGGGRSTSVDDETGNGRPGVVESGHSPDRRHNWPRHNKSLGPL